MTPGDSPYPADWFRVAAEDLERVGKRLKERDVDDAAFRLQQAIEKFLKGYLLARGWKLEKIHDLEALLSEAIHYDRGLNRYRPLCQQVTDYYLVERYPTFEEGPSLTDVARAYARAQRFVRRLQAPQTRRRRG